MQKEDYDLKTVPIELLDKPIELVFWLQGVNLEKLKIDAQNEIERRKIAYEQERKKLDAVAEKDHENMVNAVFDTIFRNFEPYEQNGKQKLSWDKTFQTFEQTTFDPETKESYKKTAFTLGDLFKRCFVWKWDIDPRKEKKRFVDEIAIVLAQPLEISYPSFDPYATKGNRYTRERVAIIAKRKR